MAWPKDKKPYDIYAQGTPTVKAQDRMNQAASNAVAPVVNSAREFSGKMLGGNVFASGINALETGRDKQNAYMATQANKKERESLAKQFPDGRVVGGNHPTYTKPQPQIPDGNPSVIDQKRTRLNDLREQLREKNRMGAVSTPQSATPTLGVGSAEVRKELVDKYTRLGARPQTYSGTQRVGNMDVTFAKDTPLAARKAFMEQPVAPTGQMAQYQKYANTPRGQYFGPAKLGTDQSGFLTRENAPGMGWQQRKALNEQILRNKGGLDEQGLRNEGSLDTQALQNQPAFERNMVETRGQDLTAQAAAERNRIDALTAESGAQMNQLGAEEKNLDIQERLKQSRLRDEYNKSDTTDARRKQLEAMLGIKNEPKFFTDQGVDPNTQMPTKETFVYENGQIRKAVPQQAPEMEIINGNPQYSAAYNAATPEKQKELAEKVRKWLATNQAI